MGLTVGTPAEGNGQLILKAGMGVRAQPGGACNSSWHRVSTRQILTVLDAAKMIKADIESSTHGLDGM